VEERIVLVGLLLLLLLLLLSEVGGEEVGVGLGEGLLKLVETWFVLGSVEGEGGFVEKVEDEIEACRVELEDESRNDRSGIRSERRERERERREGGRRSRSIELTSTT